MFWLNSNRMRLVVVGVVVGMAFGGGSAKADFTFGEPVNLGHVINSSAHEYSHCLSSDGLELYFGSTRTGGLGGWDLWVATRTTTEDVWGEPKNLGQLVNSPNSDSGPTLSSEGLELYFNSSRSGGVGSWDIWVTRRAKRSDPWGQAENLGPPVNTTDVEYNPTLSSDGLELYFAFSPPFSEATGEWEPKLAVAKRETRDDPWGTPTILGPTVNNWTCQDTPWISSDGLVLMFTDYYWACTPRPDGFGGTDIWFTRRSSKEAEWTTPLNLRNPINSVFNEDFPMISADGSTIYFNSDRPGGFGSQDLWQAPILPVVDFDDDGSVGLNDLTLMVESWGTDNPRCDIGPMPWGDGVVDAADLDVLMDSWDQAVDFPYDPRRASNPEPADGSKMYVDTGISLRWIPGRDAAEHDVYFGEDSATVEQADITDTTGVYRGRQDISEYTTTEVLAFGQTFFWRIDEVYSDGTVIKGQLWSFTVADLSDSFVVDDFENYIAEGDMLDHRQIYQTWWDGWEDPENGSQVGYADPPFVELTIVHGGLQSMPFFYDNSNAPISWTFREWPDPQDWTVRGVQVLTLWLYGEQDNSADPFYVGLEDSAGNHKDITHPDPAVLTVNDWQQWRIPLADFTDVDPTAIKIMYIGVGDPVSNQPGGSGLVCIDDIELHLP